MVSMKERSEPQGAERLTILRHGLPERPARTQHNADEDVLKAGDEEKGRILGILDVRLFGVNVRRDEPVAARQS